MGKRYLVICEETCPDCHGTSCICSRSLHPGKIRTEIDLETALKEIGTTERIDQI